MAGETRMTKSAEIAQFVRNIDADSFVQMPNVSGNPATGAGNLYYDTADNNMKYYNGSSWIPMGTTVNRYNYTATANQTSFTATYAPGNVDVYLNGTKLTQVTDYTDSSGTAIVLTTGADVGDLVDIVAFSAYSVADTVSASNGGDFNGTINFNGTVNVTGANYLNVNQTVNTAYLRVTQTGDLTLTGSGHAFQIGPTSAENIAMDTNEIMARNNGAAETLHINADGGRVTVNNVTGDGLYVGTKINVGIIPNTTAQSNASIHIHKSFATSASVTLDEAPSIILSENETTGAGPQGYHGAYWFGSQDTNTVSDYNWKVAGIASQGGDTQGANADGNLEFYVTSNTTSATKGAELSQSGTWSVPAQPAFEMIRTTDVAGTGFLNAYCTYNSVTFETGGSGASTSSGQYTAPVDGLYHFSFSFTASGGDGGDDSFGAGFIISNNSYYNQDYASNNQQRFNPRFLTRAGIENTYSVQKTARLSAGAKVGFYIRDWDTASVVMEHAEFSGFKFA